MFKQVLVLGVIAGSLLAAGSAGAVVIPGETNTYTFTPSPADLWDLDHGWVYGWGVVEDASWLGEGEVITGATLSFDNIRNWNNSPNDLYVHLLDDFAYGTYRWRDYTYGDWFNTTYGGVEADLVHYEDLPSSSQDLDYYFSAADLAILNSYASAGTFGLGFDPDCHFYNCGVTLTVTTTTEKIIPEPASMTLVGLGIAGLALTRFRKKRAA